MQLMFRTLLMLGLAAAIHATEKSQAASVKLEQYSRLKGKTVRLILDRSVQPLIASTSTSNIANMSLSPWRYRDSCEASRVPRQIFHAECMTSGCLSLGQGGEDAALEAKPIYYQVLVLQRVPRQRHNNRGGRKVRKRYDFRLGTEVVAVGCTCVRPNIVPQQ